MAKTKSKPRGANKYTPPDKSGAPSWIWLIAGIVIGCFIMFLIKLEPKKDIRNQSITKQTSTKENSNTSNKPKFEFSQILTGKDTSTTQSQPVTEEQHDKLDGERAAALLEGRKPPIVPSAISTQQSVTAPTNNQPVQTAVTPTSVSTAPITTSKPTAVTTPAVSMPKPTSASSPKSTPVSTTTTKVPPTQVASISPITEMNFFLQIGSYPTKNSAESIRAQVIMAGQNARLETTKTNDKIWYRVLVGPFKSKDEANKSQKQLANNGFNKTILVPRKIQ